jgi:OPT family oligopeptide transporter
VNKLFGGFSGFSLGAPLTVFTLDWTQVSGYLLSPLMSPWTAILNTMIGTLLWTWIVALGVHFSGTWYADYMPVADNRSFDNTAHKYNASRVLDKNNRLNEKAYQEYSPIFLGTEFALQYGLSFATIVSVVVHVCLYHGKDVWGRFKALRRGDKDQDYHTKLYEKYPEVPHWWFLSVFVINVGLGLFVTQYWKTDLPWWAFLFSLAISALFLVSYPQITLSTPMIAVASEDQVLTLRSCQLASFKALR